MSSKRDEGPWSSMGKGLVTFWVLGYFLYFFSIWFECSVSILGLIDYFKPIVGALNTVDKVSFAQKLKACHLQLVVVYCAFGAVVLNIWCFYHCYLVPEKRRNLISGVYSDLNEGKITKLKSLYYGVGGVWLWVFFPGFLFFNFSNSASWQAKMFFSPSLVSASLLIFINSFSVLAVVGLANIICFFSKNTENR